MSCSAVLRGALRPRSRMSSTRARHPVSAAERRACQRCSRQCLLLLFQRNFVDAPVDIGALERSTCHRWALLRRRRKQCLVDPQELGHGLLGTAQLSKAAGTAVRGRHRQVRWTGVGAASEIQRAYVPRPVPIGSRSWRTVVLGFAQLVAFAGLRHECEDDVAARVRVMALPPRQ